MNRKSSWKAAKKIQVNCNRKLTVSLIRWKWKKNYKTVIKL